MVTSSTFCLSPLRLLYSFNIMVVVFSWIIWLSVLSRQYFCSIYLLFLLETFDLLLVFCISYDQPFDQVFKTRTDDRVTLKVICEDLFFLLFLDVVVGPPYFSWACVVGKWVWSTRSLTTVSFYCVCSIFVYKEDCWAWVGSCTISLFRAFSGKGSSLCSYCCCFPASVGMSVMISIGHD